MVGCLWVYIRIATWVAVVSTSACGRIGYDEQVDPDAGEIAETDLVAYYPLDVVRDNISRDAVGDRHGTCVGGCPTTTTGVLDQAGSFTGQRLVVVDDGRFAMPNGFSVMGWAQTDDPTNRQCVVTKPIDTGDDDSNAWSLCIVDSVPYFYGGGERFVFAADSILLGGWFHLAATWDGFLVRLYVNGAEVATRAMNIEFDRSEVYLGGDRDQSGFVAPWSGQIDEVRIYGRPLSRGEIFSLITQ